MDLQVEISYRFLRIYGAVARHQCVSVEPLLLDNNLTWSLYCSIYHFEPLLLDIIIYWIYSYHFNLPSAKNSWGVLFNLLRLPEVLSNEFNVVFIV